MVRRRMIEMVLVAMVSCVLPSRAWADAASDAVRAFQRAYDTSDERVRRKAVGLLEAVPGPSATEALLPALDDADAAVRERARAVLASRVEDEDLAVLARAGLRHKSERVRQVSLARLEKAGTGAAAHAGAIAPLLRDRSPLIREAAASALGATGHRGQASVVAAAFAGEKHAETRGALLLALAMLDPAGGREAAIRTAARDKDGPPCTAALRILGADADTIRPAAEGLLRHEAWEVRVAAAEVLGRCRTDARAAVGSLIASLSREERLRVRESVAGALERITGAPLGDDADRWAEWWKKEGPGWTPERIPLSVPPPHHGPGASVARFYDLPIDGDRVVFVLDTSKSMTDPARLGEEATKMQLAIAQTAGTFAKLTPPVELNVIAFGTVVEAWRPRTVPASPGAKHEALRFLQKHPLQGRTNIFDALALAMSNPEVDSVFLLTDGAPSAGEETSREGLIAGLKHLRRWRPVRVHCVEIGAGNTGSRWRGFLAEVAAACGGRAVSK